MTDIRKIMEVAYAMGFGMSSEGYNSEYPFDGVFENDARWRERRDMALARAALAAPASGGWESAAARDVLSERRRQVEVEGWTAKCDDGYTDGELVSAAICYAEHAINPATLPSRPPFGWPWDAGWWKPTTLRRDLVKAVALLIAEIERLDRASAPQVKP